MFLGNEFPVDNLTNTRNKIKEFLTRKTSPLLEKFIPSFILRPDLPEVETAPL